MKDSAPTPSNEPVPVPLLDVVQGNEPLRDQVLEAITKVVDSGWFLNGPDCRELEAEVARRCEVPAAVSCASGSDALLLAMMALEIGAGDEVILPSFTFFATASCVWRTGATPVFVDIDPVTFNLDAKSVEAAITRATKAILPVHLFGQCAEMDVINELAERHNLFVVEDAAQAIGARYQDRAAGAWGHLGCFSFYPTKNLGGMGDGGMLTARDEQLAQRLRLFAAHGMEPRYYHQVVGINSRLDAMQAAALRIKMTKLGEWNSSRGDNAARYDQLFKDAGMDNWLVLPKATDDQLHVWNQYTVRVPDGHRTPLRAYLAEQKIGTEIYYPVPLHRQQCFQSLGYGEGSLPITERAAEEVLSLPIFPELTARQQTTVVEAISRYCSQQGRHAA